MDSAEGVCITFFNASTGERAARVTTPGISNERVSLLGIETGFRRPEVKQVTVELWTEECDAAALEDLFSLLRSWSPSLSSRLLLHFSDESEERAQLMLEDWIPLDRLWGFRASSEDADTARHGAWSLRWMGAVRGFVPYRGGHRSSEVLSQWAATMRGTD